MNQRGTPGEDVPDGQILAEQVAGGLDAVRGHIEECPATGLPGIPEMGRVGTAVAFARPEGDQPADRSGIDHLVHPDRLGREHDVLQVGMEDARLLDQLEHLGRLAGVPAEGLGAGDRLAPGRGCLDGAEVELVREGDHDQVNLGIGAQRIDRVDRPAAELPGKGLAPLRSRAVVGDDPGVRGMAQAQRVERADEPGAKHPDPNVTHQ